MAEIQLGAPQSVYRDPGTGEIVLIWWRLPDKTEDQSGTVRVAEARIDPTDLLTFLEDVNREAVFVLRDIAKDYEYGDCDVCGNRRLVDVVKFGRATNISCPACRGDRPAFSNPKPFENRPRLRHGTWDPTTPYPEDRDG